MTVAGAEPAGDLTLVGRIIEASNATFLVHDDDGVKYVYKPVAGEAPLWDFPRHTLWRREVAAYRLSAAAGFDCVPPTAQVGREAPLGPGSLQTWVDPTGDDVVDLVAIDQIPEGWFGVMIGVDADDRDVALAHADDPRLRQLALFDVVANNADRKAGHIIVCDDGRLFGVDHGVCFHDEQKLRTVLWGWSGEPFSEEEVGLLTVAFDAAAEVLPGLVAPAEVNACLTRITDLLDAGAFPDPGGRWPVIPWPPI